MSLYAGVAWGMLNCSLHTQDGPASVQRISQEKWFLHTPREFGPLTQPLLLGQGNAVRACKGKHRHPEQHSFRILQDSSAGNRE